MYFIIVFLLPISPWQILPSFLPFWLCFFLSNKRKEKKSTKQKSHKKTNQTTTKHGICFMLINSSWEQGLPWSVADVLNDMPLEETDFPFPMRCQKHGILPECWSHPCTGAMLTFSVVAQF